jgi:hypothetical protein
MNKFHKISLMHNMLIAAVLVVLFVPHLALAETGFIKETLWSVVNAVFGFFAWLGGQTLDYAVTHYVVGFGHNFLESGAGNSVNILWTVVRDVFNLTFIFGLVYIGLKLILNNGDSRARSMLVSLILAALLVNFSLFITKFVIDFSNIAAAQIAAAFQLQDGTHSVSSSFMNILGFNQLFSPGATLKKIAADSASYTYIFSTMFLYIILAFVFMAGGIMLIIRYIVLIIYMILSPIMFLGWVFPGFASVSQDYWKKFMSRAFFAPAYLLMLFFANQVLVSMQGANGINTGSYGAVFSGQTDGIGNHFGAVVPFFFMTAGFLIASLVVAQKMGTVGANSFIALGNKMKEGAVKYSKQTVSRVAVGGTAAAARQTVGRTGNYLANKRGLQNWSAQKGVKGVLGRATLKTAQGAANSNFDARNLPIVGGVLAQGTTDKNKKGYVDRRDAARKKRREKAVAFGNTLGETDITTEEGRRAVAETAERIKAKERARVGSDLHTAESNHTANTAAASAAAAVFAAKEAEIAAEKSRKEAEIAKLEEELKEIKRYNPLEADKITEKLASKKAELENIEQTSGLTDLKNDVAAAQAKFASSQTVLDGVMQGLEVKAKSATQFANQITWAQTMQGKAEAWHRNIPVVSRVTGTKARAKDVADYLQKYYGDNGQNAAASMEATKAAQAAKDGESKLLKELQKKLKEGDAAPEPAPPAANPTNP